MLHCTRSVGRLGAFLAGIALPAATLQAQSRIGDPQQWFASDPPPAQLVDAGISGSVTANLEIDGTGKVVGCDIVRSQNSHLDSPTCEAAIEHGRYEPAYDRSGQAVPSYDLLSVTWRQSPNGPVAEIHSDFGGAIPTNNPARWVMPRDLPRGEQRRTSPGSVHIAFTIDADGRIRECSATETSGSSRIDSRVCSLLQRRARFSMPVDRRGEPRSTTGRTVVAWCVGIDCSSWPPSN